MKHTPPTKTIGGDEMPLFPNIHQALLIPNTRNLSNVNPVNIASPFAIPNMDYDMIDEWMSKEDAHTVGNLHLWCTPEVRLLNMSIDRVHDMTVLGSILLTQYN